MLPADDVCTQETIEKLQEEIRLAEGNEVFFQGRYDENGLLVAVEVLARGNADSVAARLELDSAFAAVIHNHPSGELAPSAADTGLSAILMQKGYSFLIIDNAVTRAYVVVEASRRQQSKEVDPEEVDSIFREGGRLSQAFPEYEYREGQHRMAMEVLTDINEGKHSVLEASTGTGKSLAYLVPLVLWSLENGQKGLVCTNTLNLQDQILYKDIPLVRSILGKDFRVSVVRGRGNYLCLRKLSEAVAYQNKFLEDDKNRQFEKIAAWSEATLTGLRSELAFTVDNEIWEDVSSDSETCLGNRCSRGGECFYRKARMDAIEANILVGNYAIFFIDLVMRDKEGPTASFSLMPSYMRVIFDEAHNIPSHATEYFASTLSNVAVFRRLGRLFQLRGRARDGVLPRFLWKLQEFSGSAVDKVRESITALEEEVELQRTEMRPLFRQLYQEWSRQNGGNSFTVWINEEYRNSKAYTNLIRPLLQELEDRFAALASALRKLYEYSLLLEDEVIEAVEGLQLQISRAASFFADTDSFFRVFLAGDNEDFVNWAEGRVSRNRLYLKMLSSPLHPAELFHEHFITRFQGVVYTSATLSVQSNFSHFNARTGLERLPDTELRETLLPVEFNYAEQSMLAVCRAFPQQNDSAYTERFAEFAVSLTEACAGRIFFLFTSWKTMQACHEKTALRLAPEWRDKLLVQGQGMPRGKMLELFRSLGNAILFGVNSFWEGVDVRGDALVCVVMNKLPFQVPDQPLVKARARYLKKHKRSPFREDALPQAVIRLKQGFGRLVRTANDYGVVLLLDERLATKSYGKVFLESLPPARRVFSDQDTIVQSVADFLEQFS